LLKNKLTVYQYVSLLVCDFVLAVFDAMKIPYRLDNVSFVASQSKKANYFSKVTLLPFEEAGKLFILSSTVLQCVLYNKYVIMLLSFVNFVL